VSDAGGRRWVRGQDRVHLRDQVAGHGDDDLFRPRRLLAHGADPNLRDPGHGTTPLEESQRGNSPAHREVEAILRPVTRGDTSGDRA
jgi:hypothetical protein